MSYKQRGRFPSLSAITFVVCALGIVGLAYPSIRSVLLRLEHWTGDWRTALLSEHIVGVHPKIAVVVFNPGSIGGRVVTPIPRDLHARVIRAVDAANPLAIGLDFYFVQASQAESDRDFLDALRGAKAPVVVGAVNEGAEQFTAQQHEYQRWFASQTGREVGYINLKHERDDVVRFTSVPVSNTHYPESLALVLAKAAKVPAENLPDARTSFRIAWLWGKGGNPDPFLTIPAQDLLGNNNTDELRKELAGRVVFTGIDLPYTDQHRTPFSVWTGEASRGVMVHAQILAQLLDGRQYRELTALGDQLLVSALGVVAFVLSWRFWQSRASFLSVGTISGALIGLDAISYYSFHLVLPLMLGLYVWSLGVAGGLHARKIANWAFVRAEMG